MSRTRQQPTRRWSRGATIGLALLALPAAAAAQAPDLPPIEELVAARLAVVEEVQRAEIARYEYALDRSGWFQNLVLDRVSITSSYGRGLHFDAKSDLEGNVISSVQADQTTSKWAISYALPLSALVRSMSGDSMAELDLELARALHRRVLLDEEIAVRAIYSTYLTARSAYETAARQGARAASWDAGGPPPTEEALAMRHAALRLLVLADRQDRPRFAEWQRFLDRRPDAGVQVVSN